MPEKPNPIISSMVRALPHKWKDYIWQIGIPVGAGFLLLVVGQGEIVLRNALYYLPTIMAALLIFLARFIWFLLENWSVDRLYRFVVVALFVVTTIGSVAFGRYWGNKFYQGDRGGKGESLGEYQVKIGHDVIVAQDELRIAFDKELYEKRYNRDKTVDSELVFPEFTVWYPGQVGYGVKPLKNFKIGRWFRFKGPDFAYNICLESLVESNDTIATFKVFRKDVTVSPKNDTP